MTFFSDLAGTDAYADLVLAVRVEGVPTAFVERAIPVLSAPALSGYTQFAGLTRVEEGEAVLDLEERREMAATLDLELLDDDAGTLSALFAVNTRRTTWIAANASAAATSLTVNDNIALAAGQTVYTDNETITIGTLSGAVTLNGCTRGAFGSTAAALFGAADDGDPIYAVPPSWVGRRAYLYGYTLTADNVANEQLLGVWIIDEPPRCTGDGIWVLRFASVAQEIYERSIGVGLREAKIIAPTTYGTSAGRQTATFTVDDSTGFRLGASFPAYVLLQGPLPNGDVFTICELQAVALPPGTQTVTVYADGTPWAPNRAQDSFIVQLATSLRPIAFAGGAPQALLYALMSNEGQGATSYDRLPGRLTSGAYDIAWRFGAGLTTAEVDTTAFVAMQESRTSMMIIDDERSVSDLLREWCLLNGTATRITADGKVAPFSLAPSRVSATTLGPDDVIPDSRIEVVADESALTPLASVLCNYNPFTRDHSVELNLIDASLAKRYARNQARRDLEFRSIGCSDGAKVDPAAPPFSHPAALPAGEIASLAADIMRGDNGLARRYISLSLTMAHLDLRIGDVVTLSSSLPPAFSALPDLRGGTIAGARARVVARRPRYDAGRVDVRLLILDPLLVVCPTAAISSIAGTTLTLSTLGDEVSGVTPAQDFIVNAAVRIFDVSAGVMHTTTVTSITSGTQIVVAVAPPFAIQSGVDYIVLDPALSTVGGTSPNGYSMSEFATAATNDGAINSAANAEVNLTPRWR